MRPLIKISSICLLFYLPLYADEVVTVEVIEIEKPTISTLINEVKNAPDEQKRELMNQLKVQLKSMNKESRQLVMKELKESFSTKEEGNHRHKEHQRKKHESCQQGNHQPKFRHLRQGAKDGYGSRDGRREEGGQQPHQGEGNK